MFRFMRKFALGCTMTLLLAVYLVGYGVVRLSGVLVHRKPIPFLDPRHRVEAPPPEGQAIVTGALKSTTRLSDLRNLGEALKESYQKEERKATRMETLYYPLRKLEEALWNAGE